MIKFSFVLLILSATIAPGFASARQIEWSGYTWDVRDSRGGPGPNLFSDSEDNVFVDEQGNLHLKIRQNADGQWTCSEIRLDRSLTFGTYEWEVASRYDRFDPQVVAGLYTYLSPRAVARQTPGSLDNGRPDTPHEIDIELTQAFHDDGSNLHFTTHDPDVQSPGISYFASLNGSNTTHRFTWSPDQIRWASFHGHYAGVAAPPFPITEAREIQTQGNPAAFEYTGPVIPEDLDERPQINFWLFKGTPPESGREHELIITSFTFTPLPAADHPDADD